MSSVYSNSSSRRPSKVSVPSSYGSKRWDSFLNTPYEKFDIDEIFAAIDAFKPGLSSEPDLRNLRSFTSQEAADVAAATRFRLELERREQPSDYEEDYAEQPAVPPLPLRGASLAYTSSPPAPSTDQVYQPENRRMRRTKTPEPIVVNNIDRPADIEETHSAPLLSRFSQFTDSASSEEAIMKSHRRHVTISEARGQSKNMIMFHSPSGTFEECTPPLPRLSPSASVSTPSWANAPSTPLFINAPNEDQIRREMELFSLHDGTDSLINHRYRNEAPPNLQLDSDDEGEDFRKFRAGIASRTKRDSDSKSMKSMTPSTKKRKSVFSVFSRKSEVDKLLDLYLEEPNPTELQHAKKHSMARRMTRSGRRRAPEVPAMPPLPQYFDANGYRPG